MPSPRGAQLCRLLSTSHSAGSMTLTTARQVETASMHCFSTSSKAFDLVDHSILLTKLKAKNINKSLWLWIQSFLSSRTQQVKLPSTVSTIRPCPAGVPQGCVISPLLFNIHIDDIEDAIPNNVRDQKRLCKYADDCTVFMKIHKG